MPDEECRALNIAFLVGTFPSLSETFVLNQITGMIDRGHRVTIFAERAPSDIFVHEEVVARSLKPHRFECLPESPIRRFLELPKVWKWDRYHWRSLNLLRYGLQSASLRLLWAVDLFNGCREFDVIHCHFGALGLKAALLRRTGALNGAILTSLHGEDILNYPRRFFGNIYKAFFAECDLVLPISDRWNTELIRMGCPPGRIRRHRMGIDPNLFQLPGENPARNRPPGPLRVLTVGRLVEKKGILDAIRAIGNLQIECEYTVAGEGPLRTSAEKLVSGLGLNSKVRFLGASTRARTVELLKNADVFLAPSVTASDGDIEGIPVAIMEAMAAGLPVISTLHSAIPELVAPDISGYLVAEHDIEGISLHLSKLAADPLLRAQMGGEGRKIVEAEYNIHRLNAQLEGYYREASDAFARRPYSRIDNKG